MTIRLRFAPRPGAAPDPKQDLLLQGDIRIGRAPHCELRLLRPDIRFEHAVLRQEENSILLEAHGGPLSESTKSPRRASLAPGESTRLGPFLLHRAPDAAGEATIILAPETPADDESAVAAYYTSAFDVRLPNIRLLAVTLSCLIAVLFLVLPLSFGPSNARSGPLAAQANDRSLAETRPSATPETLLGALWTVGTISTVHGAFGDNCAFCHLHPFARVPSGACLGCHRDTGQHASPALAPAADLSHRRCESCHREHKGLKLATRDAQSDCVTCHRNLKSAAPDTKLRDLHDFATDHPQFAASLVQDAALRTTFRADIGTQDPPEKSGLRFTHAKHLALEKLKKPGNAACAACHVPDPGGVTFKPVEFEPACAGCHTLQFEPLHPEWRLPHGHPEEVASRIAGYYARAALAGERFPAPGNDLFAKPGAPLPAPAPTGADLVSAQTAAAMMSSIARSACGQCHTVTRPAPTDPPDAWKVAPVYVPDRYLLRATFSHASHATTQCAACHAARTSDAGPLALLPGIETCRQCHAGEAGAPHRVASPCAACHVFHEKTLPIVPAPAPVAPHAASSFARLEEK
jgi:mono/diheme cytochrome c family protein